MTMRSSPLVMDKLTINVPGAPAWEIELKPGVNRFGRSLNTDFQISHPSVSGTHCEIMATDGGWTVKDLGSTNGTLLDGTPVRESPWQRGQTLRLGEAEITFTPENALSPAPSAAPARAVPRLAPPAATALTTVSADVPLPPPMPGAAAAASAPRARVGAKPAVRPPQSFFAAIPGAFVFPFRRSGLVLLAGGAIFFVVLNFLERLAGFAFFGIGLIIGLAIGIFCAGYLFSFLKTIIATTAQGDDEMPDWPEYDGWVESGFYPFFELLAVLVVCLGPSYCYIKFVHPHQAWLAWTLFIGGLAYMPMALLALAVCDNLAALNPVLVLVSIARVPLEYAATCLVLGLLVLSSGEAANWLKGNVDVPVVAPIVAEFLSLYTLTVVMRVAGLLYYAKKNRLNWNLRGK
jgi:pSer/pThr/pTyr-binding forkhead associated (FHA) protein